MGGPAGGHARLSLILLSSQELLRRVRSILNKLTPQMFQQLMKQVMELSIDTEERLKGVIDLVFEKAISEPNFSVAYANMCRCLMGVSTSWGALLTSWQGFVRGPQLSLAGSRPFNVGWGNWGAWMEDQVQSLSRASQGYGVAFSWFEQCLGISWPAFGECVTHAPCLGCTSPCSSKCPQQTSPR